MLKTCWMSVGQKEHNIEKPVVARNQFKVCGLSCLCSMSVLQALRNYQPSQSPLYVLHRCLNTKQPLSCAITSTTALFMCIRLVLLLLPLHSTVAIHHPTLFMMQLSSFSLVSNWMIFTDYIIYFIFMYVLYFQNILCIYNTNTSCVST